MFGRALMEEAMRIPLVCLTITAFILPVGVRGDVKPAERPGPSVEVRALETPPRFAGTQLGREASGTLATLIQERTSSVSACVSPPKARTPTPSRVTAARYLLTGCILHCDLKQSQTLLGKAAKVFGQKTPGRSEASVVVRMTLRSLPAGEPVMATFRCDVSDGPAELKESDLRQLVLTGGMRTLTWERSQIGRALDGALHKAAHWVVQTTSRKDSASISRQ